MTHKRKFRLNRKYKSKEFFSLVNSENRFINRFHHISKALALQWRGKKLWISWNRSCRVVAKLNLLPRMKWRKSRGERFILLLWVWYCSVILYIRKIYLSPVTAIQRNARTKHMQRWKNTKSIAKTGSFCNRWRLLEFYCYEDGFRRLQDARRALVDYHQSANQVISIFHWLGFSFK